MTTATPTTSTTPTPPVQPITDDFFDAWISGYKPATRTIMVPRDAAQAQRMDALDADIARLTTGTPRPAETSLDADVTAALAERPEVAKLTAERDQLRATIRATGLPVILEAANSQAFEALRNVHVTDTGEFLTSSDAYEMAIAQLACTNLTDAQLVAVHGRTTRGVWGTIVQTARDLAMEAVFTVDEDFSQGS